MWCSGLRIWNCHSCGTDCSYSTVSSMEGELPNAMGEAKKNEQTKPINIRINIAI